MISLTMRRETGSASLYPLMFNAAPPIYLLIVSAPCPPTRHRVTLTIDEDTNPKKLWKRAKHMADVLGQHEDEVVLEFESDPDFEDPDLE